MGSVDYEIKVMAKSPFVRTLTLAVIRNILSHQISYDEKHVIDADLVPRVSQKVAQASLREGQTEKFEEELVEPAQEVLPARPLLVHPQQRVMAPPAVRGGAGGGEADADYGKIAPMLGDTSVSTIECPGPEQPLVIIRAGRRQFTQIRLTQEEITDIFETVSEKARIPLLDGMFRAAVDHFSLSGIVSDMVGNRFVIHKQTPYALLEGRG